jgi:cyclic-di-GMP-binding protein
MADNTNKLKELAAWLTDRDFNEHVIRDWLADLSFFQIKATSSLLYKALLKLEKAKVSENHRITLLALLHQTVIPLSQQFVKNFLVQGLVNYHENLAITLYLNSLQLKFAKVCFNVLTKLGKHLTTAQQIALIYQAMNQLGSLILCNTLLYRTTPAGTWQLLHKLYYYAASHELEINEGLTLAQLYKHILLLAMMDTSHLHQQDIESLYNVSIDWARLVHLETHIPQPYKVCPDTDLPPFNESTARPVESKRCLYIEIGALIRHIQQLLAKQQAAAGKIKQGIASHALEYLIKLWAKQPQCKYTLLAETGQIEICLGLAAVHYFANGRHDLVNPSKASQTKARNAIQSAILDFLDEKKQTYFKPGELDPQPPQKDAWQFDHASESVNEPSVVTSHQTYHWQIVNTSARGYCLAIHGQPPEILQIGKIVGLKVGKHWYIGVIRWLQASEFGKRSTVLHAGIELLAPTAIGVALQADSQNYQFYGLRLPALAITHEPDTLLTPALVYQVGDELTLQEPTQHARIKLTRLLTQNYNYAQFEFEVINLCYPAE